MNTRYGFGKAMVSSFDAAIEKVTEELQKEGFGMLTDIDVAAILKKDSPPLAHRALEAEPSIAADTRSRRSLASRAVKARTQQMQANMEKNPSDPGPRAAAAAYAGPHAANARDHAHDGWRESRQIHVLRPLTWRPT